MNSEIEHMNYNIEINNWYNIDVVINQASHSCFFFCLLWKNESKRSHHLNSNRLWDENWLLLWLFFYFFDCLSVSNGWWSVKWKLKSNNQIVWKKKKWIRWDMSRFGHDVCWIGFYSVCFVLFRFFSLEFHFGLFHVMFLMVFCVFASWPINCCVCSV